jgi:hypothetical protein
MEAIKRRRRLQVLGRDGATRLNACRWTRLALSFSDHNHTSFQMVGVITSRLGLTLMVCALMRHGCSRHLPLYVRISVGLPPQAAGAW